MGNFHSNPCDTDAGCYGDPDAYSEGKSPPPPPKINPFVKSQTSLGLQKAEGSRKSIFNTAHMGQVNPTRFGGTHY